MVCVSGVLLHAIVSSFGAEGHDMACHSVACNGIFWHVMVSYGQVWLGAVFSGHENGVVWRTWHGFVMVCDFKSWYDMVLYCLSRHVILYVTARHCMICLCGGQHRALVHVR